MNKRSSGIISITCVLLVIIGLISLYFQLSANAPVVSADMRLYDSLRGHASFNVVIVVFGMILSGLLITLIRLDRKVARLENEMKGPKP